MFTQRVGNKSIKHKEKETRVNSEDYNKRFSTLSSYKCLGTVHSRQREGRWRVTVALGEGMPSEGF